MNYRLVKQRVELARVQAGIKSDREIARMIGVPPTTLVGYLSGQRDVPAWVLFALSKVLQRSPAWLCGEEELVPVALTEPHEGRKVPISGVIPASRRDASLPSQGPLDFIALPDGVVADEALEVRNGCMSPSISEGDIVFVRKTDLAVPERIYVLEVTDTGERTLKRCKIIKGRVRFVGDNPEYADASYSLGEVRVLAEVVAWLHREKGT
jgi:SOS-response transcriptional repressor LexA